jgi:hypothetical protein
MHWVFSHEGILKYGVIDKLNVNSWFSNTGREEDTHTVHDPEKEIDQVILTLTGSNNPLLCPEKGTFRGQ